MGPGWTQTTRSGDARKKLTEAKGSSSTSSQTSSSSSEDKGDDELLEGRSKIQKLADQGPGLLAAAVVGNMKSFVVQATGLTWSLDEDTLPVCLRSGKQRYKAQWWTVRLDWPAPS